MLQVYRSRVFDRWLSSLRDAAARARILVRIDRLARGNPGDARSVGEGVSELQIDFGPGYRVYFLQRGDALVVLLCGGDKSTQQRDIKQALAWAAQWRKEYHG